MTPISATFLALAVGLAASPVAAATMAGLGNSAMRVMAGLNEPGALLVWGTLLAGLARALEGEPTESKARRLAPARDARRVPLADKSSP